jgi:hypothetical protein
MKLNISFTSEGCKQKEVKIMQFRISTVTQMTIAKQQLCKHIPGVTLSTIQEHPSRGREPPNTHS